MSSASASLTVKFTTKSGTYTALIMSPSGDLYQEYEGTTSEVTAIYPDFETTQPELYFVCTSSRVSEGVATPDAMSYYFNDSAISFDSSGVSTGIFAGYFERIYPNGDQLYYGLKILKNIVELSGFASATILMVATVSYSTQSDTIQASYPISISQSTGSSYKVTITAGDTNNFVISDKSGSCILKAMAYQGGVELTQNLSYVWEKMGDSGWETLTTSTSQTLTVSASDINTYGEYRVTISRSGSAIGSDIQGVMDTSDPYEIQANAVPADMSIEAESDTVVFTPTVVTRGTNTQAMSTLFYFVSRDSSGVLLNTDSATAKSSHTVDYDDCVQAGGDVTVVITSVL